MSQAWTHHRNAEWLGDSAARHSAVAATHLARGLNALWSNGGAMYGMPIR